MIIKVIGRKGFSAIGASLRYVCSDRGKIKDHRAVGIFHNCRRTDLEGLIQEFEEHHREYAVGNKRLKNSLYHIVMSFSPRDKDLLSLEMLNDLAQTYIQKALPKGKVVAVHHLKEDHLHTHIVTSSTAYRSQKGVWFSKEELKEHLRYMQHYQLERYPFLEHSNVDMERYGEKLHSEAEYYKRKRTNHELEKDKLERTVQRLFRQSGSSKEFFSLLEKGKLTTYNYRDNVNGLLMSDGRKIRLSRLGVSRSDLRSLDRQSNRLKELEDSRNLTVERSHEREAGIER